MDGDQLEQIALLTEVDDLTDRLKAWIHDCPEWEPARKARSLVSHLLERVATLRIRLESPLVVATFGGTGTGKSSLVNALVGEEVSTAGRQRPTTTVPVLLLHPDLPIDAIGLDPDDFHVKRIESEILRDIVVIDCPDPDTSETAAAGTNLALLRSIVPKCDVLLYTSTQQKYKNAVVIDELADVAAGCRLVFVQTHADLDSDIRQDWGEFLADKYDVPEMFFVDSQAAYQQQQNGTAVTGDFARLQTLLSTQLGVTRRVAIRRANLIDLLQEALTVCRKNYDASLPAVKELADRLDAQRQEIRESLKRQLCDELLANQTLWERRMLGSVADKWGVSPFSTLLRLYNGLGSFVASFTFFRARTSAQMALIGAVQGARWMKGKVAEQDAESSLARVSTFGVSDGELQKSRMLVSESVRAAEIDPTAMLERTDLSQLRKQAATLEDEFLGDATRLIDQTIEDLAKRNSQPTIRYVFEALFLTYLGLILGRVGINFFWSMFLKPIFSSDTGDAKLLTIDFYIPALIFLVIWSVILVTAFTARLRQGLKGRIEEFAESTAGAQLLHGLFPGVESTCEQISNDDQKLTSLLNQTTNFRNDLADPTAGFLGSHKGT